MYLHVLFNSILNKATTLEDKLIDSLAIGIPYNYYFLVTLLHLMAQRLTDITIFVPVYLNIFKKQVNDLNVRHQSEIEGGNVFKLHYNIAIWWLTGFGHDMIIMVTKKGSI